MGREGRGREGMGRTGWEGRGRKRQSKAEYNIKRKEKFLFRIINIGDRIAIKLYIFLVK